MTTDTNSCTVNSLPKKTFGSHWSNGLLKSLNDPSKKILEDDLVIILKDLYPKAICHFLVCPKDDIQRLKDLKSEHIPLLKHMANMAEKVTEKYNGMTFLIGYHAIPNMLRLHLHVISDDFNSKHLKTKKHWNSFNTDYFIPSSVLINRLESGRFKCLTESEGKELLNTKLKCHKCQYCPKGMPDLKNHILMHM